MNSQYKRVEFKNATCHVRIHDSEGYLMSINFDREPEDIISQLLIIKKSETPVGD